MIGFEQERAVREQVSGMAIRWREAEGDPFGGASTEDYARMLTIADIVADEGRQSVQRWADAARRAGISWSEIGQMLGISKQAAQQRFGKAEPIQLAWTDQHAIIRSGVTAFNEEAVMAEEGARGRALIGTALLTLKFRQTDQRWEHLRVTGWNREGAIADAPGEGWEYVSSWFPFQYLRRVVG